jgi:hypothetical protein
MLAARIVPVVLALLVSAAGPASGQVLRRVNQAIDTFDQFEVDLGINPVNPQQIVAAYIETHSASDKRIGVSISNDGGSTWADATDLPNPYQVNADPSVGFDSAGNIVIGYLSYDPNASVNFMGTSAILVARSMNGGATWQTAVVSRQLYCGSVVPFEDKPWIAVDTSPASAYKDTIHVVWERDRTGGTKESDIYYSRGTFTGPGTGTCVETCPGMVPACTPTGGATCPPPGCNIPSATFSAPVTVNASIPGGDFHNGPVVAVGPANGEVFVAWVLANVANLPVSGAKILFDSDQNGGSGASAFQGADTTVVSSFDTPPAALPTTLPVTGLRMRPFPSLAVDPTTPTFGSQKLYIAYSADPDGIGSGDVSDVYLVASTDSGATWSPQGSGTALNRQIDPFEGPGNQDTSTNAQFHPRVAVSPGGNVSPFSVVPGTVLVAWYDRRNDPSDNDYEIFTATIRATAQTITPTGGISSSWFAGDPNPAFQIQLIPHPTGEPVGEYLALAADKVDFVAAWTDTRFFAADDDIAFGRWYNWEIAVEEGGGVCATTEPVTAAKLVLAKLDTPPGDDKLDFRGDVLLPAPISPPLDPVSTGVRLRIDGDASILDVTVPPGAYTKAAGVGWKVDRKVPPTRWTWVDRSATPPGGIVRVVVRDRSARVPGLVRFRMRGKGGAYPVSPGGEPGTALLVLDTPTAEQCAEASFPGAPGPSCAFDARARRLVCK